MLPEIVRLSARVSPTLDAIPGGDEVRLGGGAASPVVRIGDTVRRPTGPWTPGVHALLRHLEETGFDGAPRVLDVDAQDREVLTYLPTEKVWPFSTEVLLAMARLVRRLHNALATFVPPAGATWRLRRNGGAASRIGHNDIRPANTVFANGLPYAFIDWELAGPAHRLSDLTWAAINFVPLRPDRFCAMVGFHQPPDRGRRLRAFCDEYGLDDRMALLNRVEADELTGLADIVELGSAGMSPYNRFLAGGEDQYLRRDLEWFRAHRDQLERALA